jgi:hypothetical protein
MGIWWTNIAKERWPQDSEWHEQLRKTGIPFTLIAGKSLCSLA